MDEREKLQKEAIVRIASLESWFEKTASAYRNQASLDELVYNLHVARERLDTIRSPQNMRLYLGTPFWKLAHNTPTAYEQAIRIRNAKLCYDARMDLYRNAGLVE